MSLNETLLVPHGWIWASLAFIFFVLLMNSLQKMVAVCGFLLVSTMLFWLGHQFATPADNIDTATPSSRILYADGAVMRVTTPDDEYVGYVSELSHKGTVVVLVLPQYPLIKTNCPSLSNDEPVCEQTLLEIKKSHVLNMEKLDF